MVITGRVADPALFAAPLVHEFGWHMSDCDRLGKGIAVGHLLECAGQITGGYFADPGYKDVANLARLGFPLAEVTADGDAVITKVAGSGGAVTVKTCTEQLLYELHDPARYLSAGRRGGFFRHAAEADRAGSRELSGATGTPRTGMLKVSVGYRDTFVGEGQISYAGPGCLARARLALGIVRERLALTGVRVSELRCDIIGWNALHPDPTNAPEPPEVRLRVIGRTESLAEAVRIGNEVETLYTNGPAGGGGAWKSAREVIGVVSVLIPEDMVIHARNDAVG